MALVCANCLTGSIYASTINPRHSGGIIFGGCKSTHTHTHNTGIQVARARETLRGMYPNFTVNVREAEKKRRYSETAFYFEVGRERWYQRNTESAYGEQSREMQNAKGKSWKLYDYLAASARWFECFHDSHRNWIHREICLVIIMQVYSEQRSVKITSAHIWLSMLIASISITKNIHMYKEFFYTTVKCEDRLD